MSRKCAQVNQRGASKVNRSRHITFFFIHRFSDGLACTDTPHLRSVSPKKGYQFIAIPIRIIGDHFRSVFALVGGGGFRASLLLQPGRRVIMYRVMIGASPAIISGVSFDRSTPFLARPSPSCSSFSSGPFHSNAPPLVPEATPGRELLGPPSPPPPPACLTSRLQSVMCGVLPRSCALSCDLSNPPSACGPLRFSGLPASVPPAFALFPWDAPLG